MAKIKMSARQKMINLMYLVFIAMLAMNMSKEVLSAFGFMNEKLTENNASTIDKNKEAYANLETKAREQKEKFGKLNDQANEIKKYSSDLYSYLGELKSQMTTDIENKSDYESMDKTDFLDTYFFKGDGFTPEGQGFLDKINGFRTDLLSALSADSKFISAINKRFNTEDVPVPGTDKTRPWLKARYEGFPLVASITNLTQMQADIKNTESDILSALLGDQLEGDSKLTTNNYKGIVGSDYDYATEIIDHFGDDATLVPNKVILNGKDATNNVKDGQVIIDMPAGNVGEKSIKGTIYFTEKGESIPVNFESKYTVIAEPSSAVVSADKMNVVYRGLDNPISVSLPGVGANNISVSATGGKLSKNGSGYMMRPGAANSAVINVSAKLSSGKTVKSEATFRIKDIPAAMGTVRNDFGIVPMPKSSLSNVPIGAALPDFVFDLQLIVKGFTIKVPGQLAVKVSGDKLDARAKKALAKARRGDLVTIFDIQAFEKLKGTRIKKVLPVSISITN